MILPMVSALSSPGLLLALSRPTFWILKGSARLLQCHATAAQAATRATPRNGNSFDARQGRQSCKRAAASGVRSVSGYRFYRPGIGGRAWVPAAAHVPSTRNGDTSKRNSAGGESGTKMPMVGAVH
eukprot:scaffold1472_cov310-Prasinococcus_capsulatus_cf.AAC.6